MNRADEFDKKHLVSQHPTYVIVYACVDLPTIECAGYKQGTSVGPAVRKTFRTAELANDYVENVLIPNEEEDLRANFFEEDGYSVETVREDGETHVCLYEGEYLVRLTIFRVEKSYVEIC